MFVIITNIAGSSGQDYGRRFHVHAKGRVAFFIACRGAAFGLLLIGSLYNASDSESLTGLKNTG